MIEFDFFRMPIKTLGLLEKFRVGRENRNTYFFLPKLACFLIVPYRNYADTIFQISQFFLSRSGKWKCGKESPEKERSV